jgi:hypothetical protein
MNASNFWFKMLWPGKEMFTKSLMVNDSKGLCGGQAE